MNSTEPAGQPQHLWSIRRPKKYVVQTGVDPDHGPCREERRQNLAIFPSVPLGERLSHLKDMFLQGSVGACAAYWGLELRVLVQLYNLYRRGPRTTESSCSLSGLWGLEMCINFTVVV